MEINAVLSSIGLSEGEIKVYLTLLKLGSSPVHAIKQDCNIHRTTIYDFIEKLINKGLVNYVVKGNVRYYKATYPDKLLDFVKEKEENLQEILPTLRKMSEFQKEELKVETHKGKEGFKTLLNDVIRNKEEFISFGIDEEKFKEKYPILMEQFFRKEKKQGIKERLLTSEKIKFKYKKENLTYKHIPEEFFHPTPIGIYGNKIAFIIWEPETVIIIENKALSKSFRKQFEMVWKIAKEGKN